MYWSRSFTNYGSEIAKYILRWTSNCVTLPVQRVDDSSNFPTLFAKCKTLALSEHGHFHLSEGQKF